MNVKFAYGASLILGVLTLLLVITDMAMATSNRHLQETAQTRLADINRGTQLLQINNGLVQALAEVSVTKEDSAIRGLLAAQGITINQKPNSEGKPVEPKSEKALEKK